MKWDERFLGLAQYVASWSKDPSTQTGAVVVAPDRSVVSVGFNGFPRGVADSAERLANREVKYRLVVHCEMNAILLSHGSVRGCTLYTWPFMSCGSCAKAVIQAGIIRCVAPHIPERLIERWREDLNSAASMFDEAGVVLTLV